MDGRCQDEYLHCTSPGLGCPLAAGVLGSLPTRAHGSPVLGPVVGESPVSVLASLGLLVVLVCGLLLVVLSSPASRSPNHRGHKPLSLCSALGVRTGRFGVCVSAYRGLGDS